MGPAREEKGEKGAKRLKTLGVTQLQEATCKQPVSFGFAVVIGPLWGQFWGSSSARLQRCRGLGALTSQYMFHLSLRIWTCWGVCLGFKPQLQ